MRTRLTQQQRKSEILKHARLLFHRFGFAGTEMEDIRMKCGISRGGLYHHFASKTAILDGIIAGEVAELARALEQSDGFPVEMLLEAGSSLPGNDPGILSALKGNDEKSVYLSGLDVAIARQLSPLLADKLVGSVRPGFDPAHIAELFLTVNAHINRRIILGDWTETQGAGFAATALQALVPFLNDVTRLRQIIQKFCEKGSGN